jgi:hypothetical protein
MSENTFPPSCLGDVEEFMEKRECSTTCPVREECRQKIWEIEDRERKEMLLDREREKTEIILVTTDFDVLHGFVPVFHLRHLIETDDEKWRGRLKLYNVRQILSWHNQNGLLGLVAYGPVTNEHGGCSLGPVVPHHIVRMDMVKSISLVTSEASAEFAAYVLSDDMRT